jgi:acetoacetate decarboxylase
MPDFAQPPLTSPGEIAQWPMLKIVYRTDTDAIAKLLPPGFECGEQPNVNLTIYNLPVNAEPEYGVLITINAAYNGQQGEYAIGYGIDQEAAIFISALMNGQPKFPCTTRYYRLGPAVTARCHHQGYTFLEFSGTVTGEDLLKVDPERFEWWTKYSRAVGGGEGYDFPPHVVKVHGKYGPGYRLALAGTLSLRESPWDPIATLLPMREQLSAHLWWPEYRSREITIAGELDPKAFWPFVDTIGGSRWPGFMGAPPKA